MGALGGSGGQILILVLIFAVMYFVMIRPQRKKQKQVEAMRSGIKAGDRITTIGGLKGKIVRTSDESIMIEVGPDKVRMEFMKWAVSKVDEAGAGKSKTSDKSAKVEATADETEIEADQEQEEEAPKAVKKPKRLGFKPADAEDSDSEDEAK
jgi:preprotein translocase subunit YajC